MTFNIGNNESIQDQNNNNEIPDVLLRDIDDDAVTKSDEYSKAKTTIARKHLQSLQDDDEEDKGGEDDSDEEDVATLYIPNNHITTVGDAQVPAGTSKYPLCPKPNGRWRIHGSFALKQYVSFQTLSSTQ